MKNFSAVLTLVALSVVFIAITDIGGRCDATATCTKLNEKCNDHSDCCSQYCRVSLYWLISVCKENPVLPKYETSPKIQEGLCEFHKQTSRRDIRETNVEFNPSNAAHDSLPPYTQLKVTYGKQTVLVTINDRLPRTNGTLLDLSNEAARKLKIANGQYVVCRVERVKHFSVLITVLYCLPVVIAAVVCVNMFL